MSAKMTREQIMAALKNPAAAKPKKAPRKKAVDESTSKYTAEEKAKMDAEGKGLSGAVKQWAEKFKTMKDTEFWVAACFRSTEQLEAFARGVGIEVTDGSMIIGATLCEALGVDMSVEEPPHRRMTKFRIDKAEIKRQLQAQPHPDPFAGIDYTDDLAVDCRLEFDALADAFRRGPDSDWYERHGAIDDSSHWFAVAFDSRADKDKFLRLSGWDTVGNKYLDGSKLAQVHQIEL
ncbi:hypothetical protein SEA_MORGANA_172 [Gordonia phage Morgana]|uniref:SsDNA binding protein n=1 Tax=Gordonia phage Morgana TaxID=3137292 RepID=A0AAX4RCS5_9CAUD